MGVNAFNLAKSHVLPSVERRGELKSSGNSGWAPGGGYNCWDLRLPPLDEDISTLSHGERGVPQEEGTAAAGEPDSVRPQGRVGALTPAGLFACLWVRHSPSFVKWK